MQRTLRFLSHPFVNFEEFVRYNVLQFLIQDITELYAKDANLQGLINNLTTLITTGVYYQQAQDEGVDLPQRYRINFVGAGVIASDIGAVTVVSIPGGGGGEDLFMTLTIGADGGGLDIQNLAGLRDSFIIRSIDIENRQLISSSGLVWTIDWENRLTADTAGQYSIDWQNRFLIDNTLQTMFDWQNMIFPTFGGGGTQMLTVDNAGSIGTQAIPSTSYNIVLVNATPYNVLPTSGTTIYLVDATVGNITINLPSAVGNTAIYGIKKIDATANTVILTPNGAETIDGQPTQTIRFQWTEIEIFSNNVNLFIK